MSSARRLNVARAGLLAALVRKRRVALRRARLVSALPESSYNLLRATLDWYGNREAE
jgi:hypothetical protein